MRTLVALAVFLGVSLLTGYAGSVVTRTSVDDWYAALEKPAWTPPDAVFPVVWTILYIFMGVAAWLVWKRSQGGARGALALFGVQLALNFTWSFLFFGLRRPGAAAVEIVFLWVAILATMIAFSRHSRGAVLLMAPYWAWVGFAVILNLAIWRMNA